MKSLSTLLILLALITQSCQPPTINSSFWVSGIKVECDANDSEVLCLQVYNGIDVENATWEYLMAPIEGFEFEEGYLQHIEVQQKKKEHAEEDEVSVTYTFVKMLDKLEDSRMGLNDIWVCKTIAENPIDTVSKTPTIEVNLRKMMMTGSNGCSNFTGKIESLDAFQIKLGPTAETKIICADMTVPDAFTVAINNVATYKREGLELRFYDSLDSELLTFRKVD